ncbi:MAG: YlxR family protein [Firmicutes bacterium]|nr:YlxR family protein [Bacillota bacterium]
MTKNIPQRMCIACRKLWSKSELSRITKKRDGTIALDQTGKLEGRGAYICKSHECLEKAIKTRGLNRAFKCNVPQEVYNNLSK